MSDEIPQRVDASTAALGRAIAVIAKVAAAGTDRSAVAEALNELAAAIQPTPDGLLLKRPLLDALTRLEYLTE